MAGRGKVRCQGKETIKKGFEKIGHIRKAPGRQRQSIVSGGTSRETNLFIIPFLINFSMNPSPREYASALNSNSRLSPSLPSCQQASTPLRI